LLKKNIYDQDVMSMLMHGMAEWSSSLWRGALKTKLKGGKIESTQTKKVKTPTKSF